MIGEVYNGSDRTVDVAPIAINFFDANGGLVDTTTGLVWLNYIAAGEKSCFIAVLQQPANWSYYEFEPPRASVTNAYLPALTVFNDSGTVTGASSYKIIGQVRNDDSMRVNSVKVVGTLYNDSNVPLGCWIGYVGSSDLEPGQVSSFNISYSGRSWSDIQVYHLQPDGYPQ